MSHLIYRDCFSINTFSRRVCSNNGPTLPSTHPPACWPAGSRPSTRTLPRGLTSQSVSFKSAERSPFFTPSRRQTQSEKLPNSCVQSAFDSPINLQARVLLFRCLHSAASLMHYQRDTPPDGARDAIMGCAFGTVKCRPAP
jgi:hypothetical protein